MKKQDQIMVGGQAVLEGVMMRSPEYVTVAVRKPDGGILLKKEAFQSWTRRFRMLGWPFIRGGVVLIESMVMGIRALNFSSSVAMEEETADKKKKPDQGKNTGKSGGSDLTIVLTMIVALGMGIGIFFYLPLILTDLVGATGRVSFNLVDGLFRLLLFLAYLFLISLWKDIRRVFEYHGAEHKSIFAFENGQPLTPESVKSFTTHHPRCGTSFLLVVMIVSILVFIPLGRPDNISERLIRLLFIPVIGGLSYEIIRLSSSKYGKQIAQVLVAPGLWLQRITTKEPDNSQLEVALVALKAALNEEVGSDVEWVQPENPGKV
ncbi:DUF1385 domain-containing protein [bacterium]|nr:DUF1385 domain-containing protein [bacterium]